MHATLDRETQAWQWLAERYALSEEQLSLFRQYAQLIQSATSNVTALCAEHEIVYYHFADSLELGKLCSMENITSVVDVGSGGGFPGIPLSIKYPTCTVLLLEVIGKKREFLQHTIEALGLVNCTVNPMDWRTFVRSKTFPAELICARASLSPRELLRMYTGGSLYQQSMLIYWASERWQPSPQEQAHIAQVHTYTVGERTRKLVQFGK